MLHAAREYFPTHQHAVGTMSTTKHGPRARLSRTRKSVVWLAGLLTVTVAADLRSFEAMAQDLSPTEPESAAQYVTGVRRLLETRILPNLQRGIVEISSSRPPALTLEMTDNPSPYNIRSEVKPDGSLIVQLSIGYIALHDAALDAVALSKVLNNPRDLNRYLLYQLRLARENHRRRAQGMSAHRASSFAEFIRLKPQVAQRIFAQREWRLARDRVQADSVGWVVAHLLVRTDPKLAGVAPLPAGAGAGAARLAAASGWFPVPPVATALGIAAVERSPATSFDEQVAICDAADLMEEGISVLSSGDASAQTPIAEIRAQVARMRREGRCTSDAITAAMPTGANVASTQDWPSNATKLLSPLHLGAERQYAITESHHYAEVVRYVVSRNLP